MDLLADCEKRIQAFETKFLRNLFNSYLEQKTNNRMHSKTKFLVGLEESLLATVTRQKLAWFRHVTCKDILSCAEKLEE